MKISKFYHVLSKILGGFTTLGPSPSHVCKGPFQRAADMSLRRPYFTSLWSIHSKDFFQHFCTFDTPLKKFEKKPSEVLFLYSSAASRCNFRIPLVAKRVKTFSKFQAKFQVFIILAHLGANFRFERLCWYAHYKSQKFKRLWFNSSVFTRSTVEL